MFLAGVLCMCAAAASALFGSWSLFHTPTADPTALALRAMAPTQLAAAVMLAAGGVVAVAAPGHTASALRARSARWPRGRGRAPSTRCAVKPLAPPPTALAAARSAPRPVIEQPVAH